MPLRADPAPLVPPPGAATAPPFVQVMGKHGWDDPAGRRVRETVRNALGLETGRVQVTRFYLLSRPWPRENLERLAQLGLRDPVLHEVSVGEVQVPAGYGSYLLVARLPGVTDDEGRSAQRTLLQLDPGSGVPPERQFVFSEDLYFFERELEPAELNRIGAEVLGNPLVHHLEHGRSFEAPRYVPEVRGVVPPVTATVDLEMDDAGLAALSQARGLSLSLEELHAIRDHQRDPGVRAARRAAGYPEALTDCELEVLAQTWSEHCKHKEFDAVIEFEDLDTGERRTVDSLFKTYIRGATEAVSRTLAERGHRWLLKVFTDNAGVVQVDGTRAFVFKVETHNSPSALDPYGGALTGIVGVNRDPLGTGRGGARLLFNTDVLCFGPPDYDRPLLRGQLHPLRVMRGVRQGIEDGGNKSGIPTVAGAIVFDERFAGKPLVFCGTGALMPLAYAGRSSIEKEIRPGDRIVMAGGRVGKDGIHGATFSSAEIDEHASRSAVQIGSPITQKQLAEFLEEVCRAGLVRCATDCGAGGLSSAVGELALLSGGARVELEHVPLKYEGLAPWEIFVSEAQERMTLAVAPGDWPELERRARRHEVEVSDLGAFSDTGALEVTFERCPVALLGLDFLHGGVPRKRLRAEHRRPAVPPPAARPGPAAHGSILHQLLRSFDICSREPVIRRYDHEVKGRSVVKPLMGPWGAAPQDAAVMRLDLDGHRGIAIAHGIAPRYGDLDPYEMAVGVFDEAVRQIVGVGGRLPTREHPGHFWSVNDNFCMPDVIPDPVRNPDGARKLGALVRMCQGIHDAATFFAIPLTSGKDSMKNDFVDGDRRISVPPTVLISAVSLVEDVRRCVTAEFKAEADVVYLLGETRDERGGSAFHRLAGERGGSVPAVRMPAAEDLYLRVMRGHDLALLESCHDLSDGGLAVALAEATFGGCGASVDLAPLGLASEAALYSESHSRFLVTVRPERVADFETVMGARALRLGRVGGDRLVVASAGARLVDEPVSGLLDSWRSGLEGWL